MINTIETRLKLNKTQAKQINSCIALWSSFYRKTWVMYNHQHLSEKQIYDALMQTNDLTSYQVKSLTNKVTTEHSKIKELTKTQVKNHTAKLKHIEQFIEKESKKITNLQNDILKWKSAKKIEYAKIAKAVKDIKDKKFVIHGKTLKAKRLQKSIQIMTERIKNDTFKLCFGSSSLFKQQPGHPTDRFRITRAQKVYQTKDEWRQEWELTRNNIWYSVGDKNKPQGNAEIQYNHVTQTLRLRVTEKEYIQRLKYISRKIKIKFEELADISKVKYCNHRAQARFIEITEVSFCHKNQIKLINAINQKQPISAKIMKKRCPNGKDIGFYVQLSFKESIQVNNPIDSTHTMGIDLNQKGLAYCMVKKDGNPLKHQKDLPKSKGFISWNLKDKSTEQRQWIISNTLTSLLEIATAHRIGTIAIENLDFSSTINQMNSGYKKNQTFNHMLTSFAKTKFFDLLKRKTERLGIQLHLVNPSYSSIGGFSKYGLSNKLPVDIAASLWLARQSIFGKTYSQENHIQYKKKYIEETSFPYSQRHKQSKTALKKKVKWKDVSSALGVDRRKWYQNIMTFLHPKVGESLSGTDESFGSHEPEETCVATGHVDAPAWRDNPAKRPSVDKNNTG